MIKKIKFLLAIVFLSLIVFATSSYAAVEVKAGTSPFTKISASNAFAICYNLRANSSTLGNNSVDPHLSLNSDWGIIAYLGASVYGCNGVVSTLNSTTTGNNSGVKDMGKSNVTFTAGLSNEAINTAATYNNYSNLYIYRNSKYVENIPSSNSSVSNKGRALYEVTGWLSSKTDYGNYYSPVYCRNRIFGTTSKDNYDINGWTGGAYDTNTFRPVIWN